MGHTKKPFGPNIVRAWFDTVFQYALRGLEAEHARLRSRNWSFRFHSRKLEYVAPIAEYLPAAARENLEQFLSFFPKLRKLVDAHDSRERELEEACNAYLDALLQSSRFRKTCQVIAEETLRTLGQDFSSFFGPNSDEAASMGILAEYVVNNVESLPLHYSTAELWNHYRERILQAAARPDLAKFRNQTERAGQAVLKANEDLTLALKNTRYDLSLEFDVPYVAELSSVL